MSLLPHSENPSYLSLHAAFLALEPTNCIISLARKIGGGFLTEDIQNFILELSVQNSSDTTGNYTYVKNVLKKVIDAAESTHDTVIEGIYERFAKMAFQEFVTRKEDNRIFKRISFLFSFGTSGQCSCEIFVVSLYCSLNLLEGDTGCALWPSSLFLSEFILSYPKMFSDKVCFEVGSGLGLVGIALTHVGASGVILSDGDMSSLENMRCNLKLNNLSSDKVYSQYLPWESASECDLSKYKHQLILGADIIYDPKCIPHLIRVLCMLLRSTRNGASRCAEEPEAPVAYIASVIRNKDTFEYFRLLAEEAHISVSDITEDYQPLNLLSYMLSYDRASIRLFKLT